MYIIIKILSYLCEKGLLKFEKQNLNPSTPLTMFKKSLILGNSVIT